jgi:glycosyltransferase involved in cell wall biosynthesis
MSSISLIIPVYKDANRLASCLESLCAQFSDEDNVEVIVVDNEGSLASELDESRFQNTKFIVETKPGSYAARNAGVRLARGDWLVFTDADCLAPDGWWQRLQEILSETTADVLVGLIDVFPQNETPNTYEFFDMLFAFPIEDLYRTKKSGVTGHLVAKRNCFERFGYFDDRLLSGADNMWCRKVFAAGGVVELANGLVVRHPARNTRQQLLVKARRIAGGKAQRAKMHADEPLTTSSIVRALFPSTRQLKKIWSSRAVGLVTKIKGTGLSILLRWYRAMHEAGHKFSLFRKLERQ